MPEMDGVEAVKAIRACEHEQGNEKETKEIPIIALTANALRGMKEFYLEHGFQDYLSKPISPKSLDDVITRWIPPHLQAPLQPHMPVYPESIELKVIKSVAIEMETQRLDILKHYCLSFAGRVPADYQEEIDTEYYEKFNTLIESFDFTNMPSRYSEAAGEQAAILKKAAKLRDAEKIREVLPAFYETLLKQRETGEPNQTLEKTLPRLKKAILDRKNEEAEAIIGELGTMTLGSSEREIYFQLYDLLLAGEARKAGIYSYINKNTGKEHLFYTIRSTMKGFGIYPGAGETSPFTAQFTEKEIAVIRLVCKGKSRRDMVKELGISEVMLKPIITSILDKTGFDSIMKFAIYAVSRGLIIPDW